MGYLIDLKKLSIQTYRELLENQNLLPGRRMLLDNIEARFDSILANDIENVSDLNAALSTPLKMGVFSKKTGIDEAYLTLLKREVGSLIQKPVAINTFPDVKAEIIEAILGQGIKTSKAFYEMYQFQDNLDKDYALIFQLCDLVRVNGIGVAAARTFYEAGYPSVTAVANANGEEMLKKVTLVNEEKQYYKAKLGVKDMQFCIDFAKLLSRMDG